MCAGAIVMSRFKMVVLAVMMKKWVVAAPCTNYAVIPA
jgi:tRNA(Arg) A34 adenosine deaminase TadA